MKPTSRPDVDVVDDPVRVDEVADDVPPRIHDGVDAQPPTLRTVRDERAVARTSPLDGAVPSVEPAPSARWVAAYAMGLVASDQQADAPQELLAYVRGAGVPVRSALRHLEDPTVGDAELRAGARALLEAALSHAEVVEAGPS